MVGVLGVRSRTDQCGRELSREKKKNKVRKKENGDGKREGTWQCQCDHVDWGWTLRAGTGPAKSSSNQRPGSALRPSLHWHHLAGDDDE